MTAADRSTSRLLVGAGLVCYAAVFAAFLAFEVPGRGIGQFYYLGIALVALAGGPVLGTLAGALAGVLWTAGAVVAPTLPYSGVPWLSSGIRMLAFAGIGGLIGMYAGRNRALVAELRMLAERDTTTGLPNTRAFEAAITRRLESGRPFALLIGDTKLLDGDQDGVEAADALVRLAELLASSLHPADDLARVGATTFAILTDGEDADDPARLSARFERVAGSVGARITFGWAMRPRDGDNALSLYRAADERLYARKLVHGRSPRDIRLAQVKKRPLAGA